MKDKIFRFEKKIFLENKYIDAYQNLIKNINYNFRKTYPERKINNIYFDNEELDFLFENIEGLSNRKKIRIRWYGECFGNINANLEYKIKNGNVGYKEIFKDIKFKLSKESKLKYLLKKNINKIVARKLESYQPILFNRYTRNYFETSNNEIRITIDEDIYSKRLFSNSKISYKKKDKSEIVILEIKYSNNMDIETINNYLDYKFQVHKHSKYVYGTLNSYL